MHFGKRANKGKRLVKMTMVKNGNGGGAATPRK